MEGLTFEVLEVWEGEGEGEGGERTREWGGTRERDRERVCGGRGAGRESVFFFFCS